MEQKAQHAILRFANARRGQSGRWRLTMSAPRRQYASNPDIGISRSKKEIRAYFTEDVAFMERKVGKGNIFSAVVHMDEKTPYLHLCFTPITEDGRLSAKEILGNRVQAHPHMACQAVRQPDPAAEDH